MAKQSKRSKTRTEQIVELAELSSDRLAELSIDTLLAVLDVAKQQNRILLVRLINTEIAMRSTQNG